MSTVNPVLDRRLLGLSLKQLLNFGLHLLKWFVQDSRVGKSSRLSGKHIYEFYLLQVSHFEVRVLVKSVLNWDSLKLDRNERIRVVINLVERF